MFYNLRNALIRTSKSGSFDSYALRATQTRLRGNCISKVHVPSLVSFSSSLQHFSPLHYLNVLSALDYVYARRVG